MLFSSDKQIDDTLVPGEILCGKDNPAGDFLWPSTGHPSLQFRQTKTRHFSSYPQWKWDDQRITEVPQAQKVV